MDTDLDALVARLINQVGHWEQPRWSADGRADVMFDLIQRLAAMDPEAAGRPVPRIGDLSLADQLRVVTDDLLRSGADRTAAVAAVEAVRSRL